MPLNEWYSGSDQSGEVSAVIEAISELLEEDNPDVGGEHLQMLKSALEIEEEPNWIAFLTGLVGMLLEVLGLLNEAKEAYKRVAEFTRPELETFDDILKVYCQAYYRAGKILLEEEKYEEALGAFFRVLPYMTLVFEDEHRSAVTNFVEHCFSELGQSDFALPFAEATAYYCPDDELTLRVLVNAYAASGFTWKAEVLKGSLPGVRQAKFGGHDEMT